MYVWCCEYFRVLRINRWYLMIFSRHAWQNSNDIKRALVVPFTFVLFACAFMSFVLFVALFLWRVHNFLAPCVLFRCYCVSECKQASNIREIHQESAFMLKKKKRRPAEPMNRCERLNRCLKQEKCSRWNGSKPRRQREIVKTICSMCSVNGNGHTRNINSKELL